MLAAELINPDIAPLKLSDSVQHALDRMTEFRVKQLPLVNARQFLGLVSDEILLDTPNPSKTLKELELPLIVCAIQDDQHAYEVLRLYHEHQLNVLPVLNKQKHYSGLIIPEQIISCLGVLSAAKETGSILVLAISNRDNSLAHIAQIVESDQTEILSSYVRSFPDSTRLEVTLKLNRTDIGSIVSAFQRYNYTVLSVFNDHNTEEDNRDRYNQLMNYLNI